MGRQYGALSGIAILLIILNHAIHFGLQVAPVEGAGLQALIVLQALGAFAVPAFLFISGAFLAYAASEFSFALIRANLARILWPYVVWSVIFYSVLAVTAGVVYAPAGYVKNLLVGYPYHFVPLLAFWYVAAPLLAPMARRYGVMLVIVVGVSQVCLLTLKHPGMFGFVLPSAANVLAPPVLFNSMADWGIYFPLGFVLGLNHERVKPLLLSVRWVALGATVAIFVAGVLNAFQLAAAPWARFLAPLPLMLLLPLVSRQQIPMLQRLELLGRRSYGLYLVHFVVLSLVTAGLGPAVPAVGVAPVVYPAFLAAALGVSLVVLDVTGRFPAGRRLYRFIFGIPPPAVPRPPVARQVAAPV